LIRRVILIVLDSVGIGALPDAAEYGDAGANTLLHVAEGVGGLALPNMSDLGLGNIIQVPGIQAMDMPKGAFGKMQERSAGKDTTTGHWEMSGVVLEQPFPTYPQGFPPEILEPFKQQIGRGILGNKAASGTEIIQELGREHMDTGFPIVYTSADSVLQIAAHEDVIPIEDLYHMCRVARKILTGEHAVGRVIARPFIGQPGNFTRTPRRHDFSLQPPEKTLLQLVAESGEEVMAVGKIKDVFAGVGITNSLSSTSNEEGVLRIKEFLQQDKAGLIFANLVDFDMLYGHRNNIEGYAKALAAFDKELPGIMALMSPEDVLVITADHGTDPGFPGTDHTREHVPVLVAGRQVKPGVDIGTRRSFSDLGATIAELLHCGSTAHGESFAREIIESIRADNNNFKGGDDSWTR